MTMGRRKVLRLVWQTTLWLWLLATVGLIGLLLFSLIVGAKGPFPYISLAWGDQSAGKAISVYSCEDGLTLQFYVDKRPATELGWPVVTQFGTNKWKYPYVGSFLHTNNSIMEGWVLHGELWLLMPALVLPGYLLSRKRLTQARRRRRGACLECGYDLRANATGVCPECGVACASQQTGETPMLPHL